MADEVVAIYRAEVEQYRKNVESLILSLGKLDAAQNKATQSASTAFTKIDSGSSVVGKNIDATTQKVVQLEKAEEKAGRTATVEFGKAGKAVNDFAANTGKADKALNNMDNGVLALTTNLKTMAGALGVAFTLDAVISFGKEAVDLAAKAEGVERAFRRIGSPEILAGLRKATRGTVTDLQLMQNAVKASNFQIPLEQLANMFKFAQSRARETGESVDNLVDSIILGIGRKSPLILDNLGISAVRLREKFNGLSVESASVTDVARVFGEIATEELAKVGNQADTTADQLAQLETKWQGIKTSIGVATIELAKFFGILDDNGASEKLEAELLRSSERAERVSYALGVVNNELRSINDETEKQQALEDKLAKRRAESQMILKNIQSIEAQRVAITAKVAAAENVMQNASNSNLKFRSAAEKERIAQAGVIIKDGEKELSLLKEQRKAAIERLSWTSAYTSAIEQLIAKKKTSNEEDAKEIISIELLEKQLKDLQDEFKKTEIGTKRYIELKGLIVAKQNEIKIALGEETDAMKKAREEREKLAKQDEERWAAIEKEADNRLKKKFEVEQFISDRTALGLKEEMDAAIKAEQIKAMAAEATAMQIGASEQDINKIKEASINEQLRIEADYRAKIAQYEVDGVQGVKDAEEEKKKAREDAAKHDEELRQKAIEDFNVYAQANIDIINAISQVQARAIEYEMNLLDTQLEQGQITREQYDARRRSLLKQQAEQNKALALMNAGIGTAVAVVNALAVGPPQGYILAAISAALGAVQIGLIASEPIPQFAKGVIGLQGAGTETSDSIPARLSKGESVMTAAETRKYRPILEGIRRGTLDEIIQNNYVRPAIDAALLNGFADMGTSAMLNDRFNDMNILRALDRHGFAEVGELREMNLLLKRHLKVPKRGYA